MYNQYALDIICEASVKTSHLQAFLLIKNRLRENKNANSILLDANKVLMSIRIYKKEANPKLRLLKGLYFKV